MKSLFTFLLGALVLLLIAFPVYVLYGWTLAVLWQWFIVPIFNVPAINTIQGLGVWFVVQFLTGNTEVKKQSQEEKWKSFCVIISKPFVYLGLGYLMLKLFM